MNLSSWGNSTISVVLIFVLLTS